MDDRTLDLIPRKKERLRSMQHTYANRGSTRPKHVSDYECKHRIQESRQDVRCESLMQLADMCRQLRHAQTRSDLHHHVKRDGVFFEGILL